jgi:hypothetical protein
MCELPKHGAQGEPSSTGISQHDQIHSDRSSTEISNDTSSGRIQGRTSVSDNKKPNPSTSPPQTGLGASHQPIERLANQLRKQSLKQPEGSVAVPDAPTAFSHQLQLHDDILKMLGNPNDTTMDMGIENGHESQKKLTVARGQNRMARKKITSDHILDMISSEFQCTIRPSPSCSSQTTPDHSLFHSGADLRTSPIEVDTDYDEDQDDFSWLESVISLRSSSTPSGVTKRFGLCFRTSADAACRGKNLVRSLPRMRRREKHSRAHPGAAGETSKGSC